MKKLSILALLALAGCVHERIAQEPIGPCRVAPVEVQFAGERWEERMRDHIRRLSNSRILRLTRPGEAVTMDFRPDRLTVTLDDNNRIAALRCG